MNVKELIDILKTFDQEQHVLYPDHNYGGLMDVMRLSSHSVAVNGNEDEQHPCGNHGKIDDEDDKEKYKDCEKTNAVIINNYF